VRNNKKDNKVDLAMIASSLIPFDNIIQRSHGPRTGRHDRGFDSGVFRGAGIEFVVIRENKKQYLCYWLRDTHSYTNMKVTRNLNMDSLLKFDRFNKT